MRRALASSEMPTGLRATDRRARRAARVVPQDARVDAGVRQWLAVYAASRTAIFAVALVASLVVPQVGRGPWPAFPSSSGPLAALGRWDGAWYLAIAERGYGVVHVAPGGHADLAFFPLYPLLVRLGTAASGASTLATAVLLSTLAGAGVVVLLGLLVRDLSGGDTAARAVTLFCWFPGAVILSMAYAESLLLLGAVGCLVALRRSRWVAAGLLGAVATASRPNGVAVVAACAVAAVVAWREDRRAVLAPVIATAGGAAVFGSLWLRTGDLFAWFHVEQQRWHDGVDPARVAERFVRFWSAPSLSLAKHGLEEVIWTAGLAAAFAGVVLLLRWRPSPAVVAYGLVSIGFACCSALVGPRPRMLLAAFPLLAALAWAERDHPHWYRATVAAFAVASLAFAAVTFTTLAAVP